MRHATTCTDCGRLTVILVPHRPRKGALVIGLCTGCRRREEEVVKCEGRKAALAMREREGRGE